jgi:uncharacterized protein
MKLHTFRLQDGQDLKAEIEHYIAAHSIRVGFIVTCVGSLSQTVLRMAGAQPDKQDIRTIPGDVEIVSLVGTVSVDGSHLHLSIADQESRVTGGHLKEGSTVHTAAEIILGEDEAAIHTRELDPQTGFKELVIRIRN